MLLTDRQRGPAYATATPAGLRASVLLARTEALVAHPVYTGKALAALFDDVRQGVVKPAETVVYIHTGGDPLVYIYADVLAQHAAESEHHGAPVSP